MHDPRTAMDMLNRIRSKLTKYALHTQAEITTLWSKLNAAGHHDMSVQLGNLLLRMEDVFDQERPRSILVTTINRKENSYLVIDHSDALQLIWNVAQSPQDVTLVELLDSTGDGRRLEALGVMVTAMVKPSVTEEAIDSAVAEICHLIAKSPVGNQLLMRAMAKLQKELRNIKPDE